MTSCIHNKRKTRCIECGGHEICVHKKRKTRCVECGGSEICVHKKRISRCIECGGSEICVHKNQKHICKECVGSSICIHNKIKSLCVECGGSQYCIHKHRKNTCRDCNGSSICVHDKYYKLCKECDGSSLCKSAWCHKKKIDKYNGYCLTCCIHIHPEIQVSRNYKTKEKDVVDRITQTYSNFTWVSDKKVQDGCSRRRPDLLLDMGSHIIIVEIDENKHTDYDCSCENKRLMELSQDVQHRPIVFIRFNPDDYINDKGEIVKSCWRLNKLGVMQVMKTKEKEWSERVEKLKDQIKYWIENKSEKTIEIIEMYY